MAKRETKGSKPAGPPRDKSGRFVKKSAVKLHHSKPAKPTKAPVPKEKAQKAPAKSSVKVQHSPAADGRQNSGPFTRTNEQSLKPAPGAIFQMPPVKPPPKDAKLDQVQDSGGYYPDRPIGPGNPPRAGQIQKGEVRNPKGYPAGRPQAKTVIKYWLSQEEEIENPLEPGEFVRVSVLDTITLQVIKRARKGDIAAYRELVDRIEGKPVQSTKLLNAQDKLLEISVGFRPPQKPPTDESNNNAGG